MTVRSQCIILLFTIRACTFSEFLRGICLYRQEFTCCIPVYRARMMAFAVNINVLIQSLTCATLMFGWTSGVSVYDPLPPPARAHYRGPAVADEYAAATDPPRYNFAYDVSDAYTGDIKSQTETRDGDFVRGQYTLVEPDGTRRVVDYTADEHSGFNAVVSKEGHPAPPAATVAPRPPAAGAYAAYRPAVSYRPAVPYKSARRPVTYRPSVAAAYRPAPAAVYLQQQPDDSVYPTAAYPAAPLYKSAYKQPPPLTYRAYRPYY